MKDPTQNAKNFLQEGLLFNDELGFDKKKFRKKCNPEVDYDKVKTIIDDAKAEERQNLLEFLRLKVLCRIRGLGVDVNHGYGDFYKGAKSEMEELNKHLRELKWIDADISCAKKYLSDVEKHEYVILREQLGFQEDDDGE